MFSVVNNFRQDVALAWNVSIERQLTSDMSFRMAYVGTAGRNLYHDYQLNQCNPPSFTTPPRRLRIPRVCRFTASIPTSRPWILATAPASPITTQCNLQLQKRTGRGLTLTAAYTWSKMMDNINNPIDSYAMREELDTANWQRNNFPQAWCSAMSTSCRSAAISSGSVRHSAWIDALGRRVGI